MTVSGRAHKIRQNDPRISWKDAMRQANKEIYQKRLQEDEDNAKQDLEDYESEIEDALSSITLTHGLDVGACNNLVEDIIDKAYKKRKDGLRVVKGKEIEDKTRALRYPAISLWRAIEDHAGGVSKVSQTVFSSSEENNFIAFSYYRQAGTGRIRSDWWDDVKDIAENLGVDITSLPTYGIVSKYFI